MAENKRGINIEAFQAKYSRPPRRFENPQDSGYVSDPQIGSKYFPFGSHKEYIFELAYLEDKELPFAIGLPASSGAVVTKVLGQGLKKIITKAYENLAGTVAKKISWGSLTAAVSEYQQEIKDWISEQFEVVKDWETFEDLKELVFGNFVKEIEKGINKKIKDDPELEWMPKIKLKSNSIDDILHDFGEWSAKVANNATSRKVGKRVEIFSTFYPPDNIADELEHFLVDEFNSATQLKISGIIGNENIKEELLEAVQKRFGDAIMEVIAKQKAKLVDKLADHEIYGTQKHVRLQVINGIIDEVIATLLKTSVVGKYYDGKAYLAKHYRKIKNRGYQKKFREKHKENRRWVRIDTGLSETAEGDPQKDLEVYQGWIP